tara:strand:+ start:4723 stop:5319 length:597 start_codon:yes stop_codon:yes gene_type:complete
MKYYEILGLTNEATDGDIKKAYRKLAKENHPDTGGDEETFKKIAEAYGVLSDGEKRSRYDRGEPVEAESKEGRARRNISKIFDTIINSDFFDPASTDISKRINGEINEATLKMNDDREDMEIHIRKLEDIKSRINGADYLIEFVDNSISMLKAKIARVKQEIEVAEIMSLTIEGFKYEQDEESENEEIEFSEEFGAFW